MKNILDPVKLLVILLSCSLVMVLSCGKEQSLSSEQEKEMAQVSGETGAEAENTFAETFDDVMGANNDVGVAGSGIFYGRPDTLSPTPRCFTVTVVRLNNTSPFPVRIIVDFGTAGCTGPDGHVRRGKILTTYTDRLINAGAIATTEFDGFYVDSVHVEGQHKITNTSEPSFPRRYKVEIINGKLTKPSGNFITCNSTKVINQVAGVNTAPVADDVYSIEGNAHGTVKRGNLLVNWESTIIAPLKRRVTCRWIVSGQIRTIRAGLPGNSPWIGLLDFGAGNCDNQAVLTINGVPHQITLP